VLFWRRRSRPSTKVERDAFDIRMPQGTRFSALANPQDDLLGICELSLLISDSSILFYFYFIFYSYSIMVNYNSIRFEDKLIEESAFIKYLEDKKYIGVIFCREDFSVKRNCDVRVHYHCWIESKQTESTVRQQFVKAFPNCKTGQKDTKLYNVKAWGTDQLDIIRGKQYHCKGRKRDVYTILFSSYSVDDLSSFNHGFWDDNRKYIEEKCVRGKKPSTQEALIEYCKAREDKFYIEGKSFNKVALVKVIISFYSSAVKQFCPFIIERSYNLLEYQYVKSYTENRMIDALRERALGHSDNLILKDGKWYSPSNLDYEHWVGDDYDPPIDIRKAFDLQEDPCRTQ